MASDPEHGSMPLVALRQGRAPEYILGAVGSTQAKAASNLTPLVARWVLKHFLVYVAVVFGSALLFTATVATYAFFAPAPPPEQPLQFLPKADRLVPPAPHIYKPASETNTIITGPMVELAPGGKSTKESSPDLNQRHGGASVAARARGRGPVLATVKSIERRSAVSQPEVNRAGTFVPAGITPSIMDAADEEAAKKPEAAQSADNQNARRRLADSMRDLAEGEREGSPGARYAPASAGREDERSEFSPTPMDAPVVPLPRSRPKKIK